MPTALGSPFHAHRPLVQTLSLTPSCPSPDTAPCSSLSLSQRAELSAAPLLPVRSCSRHEASPQLLCSALSKSRGLNHSSHTLSSRLFTIFMTLLCTLSSSLSFFLLRCLKLRAVLEVMVHQHRDHATFCQSDMKLRHFHHVLVLHTSVACSHNLCSQV